jgi:phage/plasmid primase-like uncharacterized protein
MDAIDQFRQTMTNAGLTPPDTIIADGKIHRFTTNGKRSDEAGRYVLHMDSLPAGWFGDYRTGLSQKWCSIERNAQTPEQQRQYATLLKSMQNARHRANKAEHDAAAEIAQTIWTIEPIIPVSRSCWLAGVKSGRFPKPVKLGARATAWRSVDIQALLDSMNGGAK